MLPIIEKPPITRAQKGIAIAIAGFADLIQMGLFPIFMEGGASPFEDILDIFVAIALTIVCGFKWQFAAAFMIELIPGLDLFPTWTAVVLTIPSGSPAVQAEEVDVEPNEAETISETAAPPIQTPRITVTSVPPQIAPPLTDAHTSK